MPTPKSWHEESRRILARERVRNRDPEPENPYAHGGSLHKACDESCFLATPPPVPAAEAGQQEGRS